MPNPKRCSVHVNNVNADVCNEGGQMLLISDGLFNPTLKHNKINEIK